MDLTALRDAVLPDVRSVVPDLWWLAAFGSQARGDANVDSDVDLALLAARPVPAPDRIRLAADLGATLGRDVDVVDLRTADAVLRVRAVAEGRELWSDRSLATETYLSVAYSDYARLEEERAAIVRDVVARGSVHGR